MERELGIAERAGHAEAFQRGPDGADQEGPRIRAAHHEAGDEALGAVHLAARGEVAELARDRGGGISVGIIDLHEGGARAAVGAGDLGRVAARRERDEERGIGAVAVQRKGSRAPDSRRDAGAVAIVPVGVLRDERAGGVEQLKLRIARMSTSLGVVPPMTKPQIIALAPVPTKPRVERLVSRVLAETLAGRTVSVADGLRTAPLSV